MQNINRLIFPYTCQSHIFLHAPHCMQQCTSTVKMFKTFDRRWRGGEGASTEKVRRGILRRCPQICFYIIITFSTPVTFFKTMSKTTRISNLSAHWIFTCTDILRRDVFVDNITSDLQLWRINWPTLATCNKIGLIQKNALLELDVYRGGVFKGEGQ